MKTLFVWLLIAAGTFAGLSLATEADFSAHPRKILFVIDTSREMADAGPALIRTLDAWAGLRHGLFAFADALTLLDDFRALPYPSTSPVFYGTRDFQAMRATAQKLSLQLSPESIVFITNAPDTSDLEGFPSGRVVRLSR